MSDLMSHEDFRRCLVRCGQLLTQVAGAFITLDAPDPDELTYRGVGTSGHSQLHQTDGWTRVDLLRDCLTQFQVDIARAGGGMWPFEGAPTSPIPEVQVREDGHTLAVTFQTDRDRLEFCVSPEPALGSHQDEDLTG